MRMRIGMVLVVLLVSLSACPAAQPIAEGVWLFTVDGLIVAVNLAPDGVAYSPGATPMEADTVFTGTQSWSQSGSTFTFSQVSNGTPLAEYTGRVASSASIINGTWVNGSGQMVGTWFGEKL